MVLIEMNVNFVMLLTVSSDVSEIEQSVPAFSPCLTETVLVWIPCGFLWITLTPYLFYVFKSDRDPSLPWNIIQILKSIFTICLFCFVIVKIILEDIYGYQCSSTTEVFTATYLAAGIKAATYVLAFCLEQLMRVRGIKSSGIQFSFWALTAIAGIVPFYTTVTSGEWCASNVIDVITFLLIWVQLLMRCFADQYYTRGYHELGMAPCPEESSSVLSRVTYNWMTSLVIKAYKTTLTTNDLWDQTSRLKSERVVPKFRRNWRRAEAELKQKRIREHVINYEAPSTSTKDKYGTERTPLLSNGLSDVHTGNGLTFNQVAPDMTSGPSLFRVLFKTFGWLWIEACIYKIMGDIFNLLQPLILQQIIGIIESRETKDVPSWLGYAYTAALFITSLLKSIWYHCAFNHMVCLGLTMKTSLIGAVYRKALTMSNRSKKSYTIGEIVNLISVDCQRVQDAFTFSHFLVSLPFVITVSMVQLYYFMGIAMLGGLAVVLSATAFNGYLGRLQQRLQKQILALKGKRIKILNEVINGIKVLKMYTWETPFQQRVTSIRNQEISKLWKYAILTAIAILFSVHSPFMVNYVLVLIYTLSSAVHYLDAQTAFVVLSLVNILRGPITITPFVITGMIQGHVSVSRLQAFLWKDDMDTDNVTITEKGEYAIHVENASFSWDRSNPKPTLRNIDMAVKQNKLYAVVGQVGCGKSSLISAILGEMDKLQGHVTLQGDVAFVPQEAWIQNLTVRDNILFGKHMDEDRYNKVLSGCALLSDLQILSGGDMTEIGEKGINISGGQKQRVSLARAVYSDADVYLLDDPLSAVDSHVGKHLFKNVIGPQGLLKHKTRILVTHGIHWLPMVDRILVITDGAISEEGTYEELISRNGPFAQFIQNHGNDDDDADAEDAEVREMRKRVLSDAESVASGNASDDADERSTLRRRKRNSSTREKSFGMSFSKDNVTIEKNAKNETISRLVKEEESQKGAVKFGVFKAYAKAMGYMSLPFITLFIVGFQALNVFSNYWLTFWTEDELLKNVSQGYTQEYEDKFVYYIVWYTIIGVIQGGAILGFGMLALTRMVRASGLLHKEMLNCVLRSPMSFFDTTPIGRIMNRFSSDIDVMDDRLPLNFRLWNIQIFATIATLAVVSINTPPFIIVIVPTMVVYILLLKFFLPTARQVKRLESVLRSPIYNHFSETITGASVIRAYRCTQRFIRDSEQRVDKNVKFFFAANCASRWIGVRLEFLGNILILAASIFALLANGLNGAEVGLSITYALQITISLNLVIQAISEMEMNIVSAERVKEYTELLPEAPWFLPHHRPRDQWPTSGKVEFRQYCTRYREGLDLVLRGISCSFSSGEKIGIVGRTGAGKSSLTLSLFRLIESAGGSIYIDGENIADLGLHDLRNKLTILPQDPVLFSGSLRENLDPFGRFDDVAIWKALECAHLKTAVQSMLGQLEYECGEGGSNLSMGQRQLVCLARTLLHKTHVLILDEATAAVDLETDDLIQNTIRTEFADCTILTIAHRLNTILDYDSCKPFGTSLGHFRKLQQTSDVCKADGVMVLSGGAIKELDSPSKLLQDSNSAFYKMARDAGIV